MKKPGLAIIVGKASPEKDDDDSDDKTVAAEELMSAVKANDAEGVVAALESFYALCGEGD